MRRERANVNLVVLPSPGPRRRRKSLLHSPGLRLRLPLRLHLKIHLAHAHAKQNVLQAGIPRLSLPLPLPSRTHCKQPLKVDGLGAGGRSGRGRVSARTLLEHKGNGNVELRRFLGCSVASLRLGLSAPLSLPSPCSGSLSPAPLSVCTCGKKMPAELCCLLLGDLALVRMQKRLQRFGLCFV